MNPVVTFTGVAAVAAATATAVTIPAVTGHRVVLVGVSCYPGASNQNAVLVKATDSSGAIIGSIPSLTTSGNIPWADCEIVGAAATAMYVAMETPQASGTNRITATYYYRREPGA